MLVSRDARAAAVVRVPKNIYLKKVPKGDKDRRLELYMYGMSWSTPNDRTSTVGFRHEYWSHLSSHEKNARFVACLYMPQPASKVSA